MNKKLKAKEVEQLIGNVATSVIVSAEALSRIVEYPERSMNAREVVSIMALTSVLCLPVGDERRPLFSSIEKSNVSFAEFLDNHIEVLKQIRAMYDTRQE